MCQCWLKNSNLVKKKLRFEKSQILPLGNIATLGDIAFNFLAIVKEKETMMDALMMKILIKLTGIRSFPCQRPRLRSGVLLRFTPDLAQSDRVGDVFDASG